MPGRSARRRAGSRPTRALLVDRVRERLPEIEQAALTRLYGVSEAPERPDPDYVEGLTSAIAAALEYLLAGVERGAVESLQPPPAVLVQARVAARSKVGLDTVMRRCIAGHALFGDFLMEELEQIDAPGLTKLLLREQAALLDRMLVAVSEEHAREAARPRASGERRARLVERLLAGEPLDVAAELGYELQARHIGILAKGPGAAEAMRELASALGHRLLALPREEDVLWAWLGGRDPVDAGEVLRHVSTIRPSDLRLAVGEPGEGVEGWRLSHRQAVASLPVALRGEEPVVRYGDAALLVAALKDELLRTFLKRRYLEPLARGQGRGAVLCETLRAYFAADGNVSATAATLGVKRHTVTNRLRTVEQELNGTLSGSWAELQTALRLAELDLSPTI
jgi:hypothetical protein